jgi:Chemotaxis protein histidine kinase and related kinases
MSDIVAEHKAVADFLAEAEEITDQLGSELADLVDMAESGEIRPDLLNSIFRGAHSLKGLAGMFGFKEIAELSHNMENLLDWLRLGKLNPDGYLIAVMSDSFELLSTLIRTVSNGASTVRHLPAISDCIAKINACLDLPDHVSSTSPLASLGLPARVLESLTEYEEHRLLDNVTKGKRFIQSIPVLI